MYYYLCFIFIIVTILIDQLLLLILQNLALNLPLYLLFKSIFVPYSLPNSYTLAISGGLYRVAPNKCDKASVFTHLAEEFKRIVAEASVGKVIGMIVRGDNMFYLMKNLLNISNRQVEGQKEEVKEQTSKVEYVGGLVKMITTF
jgi:hypothetical protein